MGNWTSEGKSPEQVLKDMEGLERIPSYNPLPLTMSGAIQAKGETKMKFFVPGTKDEAQAQQIWDGTKKFTEETLNWKVSDRRIFSMAYRDNRENTFVEVGKPDSYDGEIVWVILESSGPYLVCTLNRGIRHGTPILVGKEEAYKITDFEQ